VIFIKFCHFITYNKYFYIIHLLKFKYKISGSFYLFSIYLLFLVLLSFLGRGFIFYLNFYTLFTIRVLFYINFFYNIFLFKRQIYIFLILN